MDVLHIPYDQVIDIGLNVLGYLIAGTLGMVVYSMFAHRRSAKATEAPAAATVPQPAATEEGRKRLNYVDLRRSDVSEANGDMAGELSRSSTSPRRDRAEIMRLARQMMKAHTPQETIKRTLPISDGELALLQSSDAK